MNTIRSISLISVLLLLFISLSVSGQRKSSGTQSKEKFKSGKEDPWADYKEEKDSISRWAFGVNFGAYFPNKYPANYYNGTTGNINNLEYVLSNKYWFQDIKYLLGADTQAVITGYPTNMHYSVAITAGLYLRYNFSRKNGIFLQVNYTQLKAEDAVTVEVDPPVYLTDQHDIRMIPIVGREERILLDLGYQRSFPMRSRTSLFINGGFTMCYTHVKKSALVVEGREYSLINIYGSQGYIPNSNNQEFNMNQHGIGCGLTAGVGAGLPVTDMIGLETGFNMQYYPVNLEGYSLYKPSFSIYLRILLGFSYSKVS